MGLHEGFDSRQKLRGRPVLFHCHLLATTYGAQICVERERENQIECGRNSFFSFSIRDHSTIISTVEQNDCISKVLLLLLLGLMDEGRGSGTQHHLTQVRRAWGQGRQEEHQKSSSSSAGATAASFSSASQHPPPRATTTTMQEDRVKQKREDPSKERRKNDCEYFRADKRDMKEETFMLLILRISSLPAHSDLWILLLPHLLRWSTSSGNV